MIGAVGLDLELAAVHGGEHGKRGAEDAAVLGIEPEDEVAFWNGALRSARSTRPAAMPLLSVTLASTSISAAPKPRSATCQPVRDLPRYDPWAANSHLPARSRLCGASAVCRHGQFGREQRLAAAGVLPCAPHQPQPAFGRNVEFQRRRKKLAFLEEGVAFPSNSTVLTVLPAVRSPPRIA